MTELTFIHYTCCDCEVSELLTTIIPKKTCEKCGMLMQAEEY